MLKIKNEVDFKELEKFGFREAFDCYFFDRYDASIYVDTKTRRITFSASDWGLDDSEGAEHLEKLFDLIQVGLVEKAEADNG